MLKSAFPPKYARVKVERDAEEYEWLDVQQQRALPSHLDTLMRAFQEDEDAIIEQYERLAEFEKQVRGGVHPRYKVPPKYVEKVCEKVLIDPSQNYYKDLGLERRSDLKYDSILRGYKHKWELYSPLSPRSKHKWRASNIRIVDEVEEQWKRIQKAFLVLYYPHLRVQYDGYHQRHAEPLKSAPKGNSLADQKKQKKVSITIGARSKSKRLRKERRANFFQSQIAEIEIEKEERLSKSRMGAYGRDPRLACS